jgi:hypothetical protein
MLKNPATDALDFLVIGNPSEIVMKDNMCSMGKNIQYNQLPHYLKVVSNRIMMPIRFIRYWKVRARNRKILKAKEVIHGNNTAKRIAAFISIPKNASKTTLDILDLGPNRDLETTTSLVIFENHQRAAILNKKYDLHNLFVFCFVRNPYDRCVSWYAYHKKIEPYKSLNFEAWVKAGMPHHQKRQNQTDYETEGISPLLQYNYVENYAVDFIGRMENYTSDLMNIVEKLNSICAENGIEHRFKFIEEKKNVSTRDSDFESYYTQETKGLVYLMLERDFTYFGYQR